MAPVPVLSFGDTVLNYAIPNKNREGQTQKIALCVAQHV